MSKSVDVILSAVKAAGEAALRLHEENKALAAQLAAAERDAKARPLDEWHEDDGPVLWWVFPVNEPPYCGTPNDDGWPRYHTHWTRLVIPIDAALAERKP